MPAPLSRLYAEFAAGLTVASIPKPSIDVARLGFTDAIGVLLAGRNEDVVRRLSALVESRGMKPVSRLLLTGKRSGAVEAALLGATAAHALDYDDFAFSNHPSAVLVPTILAAADMVDAPGERLVSAYVAGYEIWADLFVREPELYYDRGWHPTACLGPVGAAAAASIVLGFDAKRTRHALALAASSSGGVYENFGTMAKPWHGGRTAAAGMEAALLAQAGLEGSPTALEGGRGLLHALSPTGKVDLDTPPQLGTKWRSAEMRLNIKKYPMVGSSQRLIDTVLALPEKVEAPRVGEILVHVSNRHMATMTFHRPQNAHEAKFSMQFAVACALVHGEVGFRQLRDEVVRSETIQSLFPKIRAETTDDYEPEWRDAAPWDQVTVTLDDGRVVESPRLRRPRGHGDTPLSTEELWTKFKGCAEYGGVEDKAARRLFEAMQKIDTLESTKNI